MQENPWINNDSSRPVTDIKELDYNRRLIIYRAEEPRRQLREFEWSKDERIYGVPQNLYEDYYEEIYEYFNTEFTKVVHYFENILTTTNVDYIIKMRTDHK